MTNDERRALARRIARDLRFYQRLQDRASTPGELAGSIRDVRYHLAELLSSVSLGIDYEPRDTEEALDG